MSQPCIQCVHVHPQAQHKNLSSRLVPHTSDEVSPCEVNPRDQSAHYQTYIYCRPRIRPQEDDKPISTLIRAKRHHKLPQKVNNPNKGLQFKTLIRNM